MTGLPSRPLYAARLVGDGKKRWRQRPGCVGCGPGCGGFLFVIVLGGILSIFPAAFGLGVSVGVPFMQSNITVAGGIGAKDKVMGTLPEYTRDRVGGNKNFINNSTTLTIGRPKVSASSSLGSRTALPRSTCTSRSADA